MKPELCTENQTVLIKRILRDHYHEITRTHDAVKMSKIRSYVRRYGVATKRQYRAFKHICKVYGVKIDNSITFILD